MTAWWIASAITASFIEVPSGEASHFSTKLLYGKNATVPAVVGDGVIIKLAPLELITLELTPAK